MVIRRSGAIVAVGSGIILLCFIAMALSWLYSLSENTVTLQDVTDEFYEARLISTMREKSYERVRTLFNMVAEPDPFVRDELFMAFRNFGTEFLIARDQFLSGLNSPEEERIWNEARLLFNKNGELQNQVLDLIYRERLADALDILTQQIVPYQDQVQGKVGELLDIASGEVSHELVDVELKNHHLMLFLGVMTVIFVAIVLGVTAFVMRRTGYNEVAILEQNRRVQALYEVTSRPGLDQQQHITEMLKLGVSLLGMEVGKVSRIDRIEQLSTIVAATFPDDFIVPVGKSIPLARTYCSFTFDLENTLVLEHVGESEYSKHKAYKVTGIESYISYAIRVNGKAFGTVNFADRQPRVDGFSSSDKDLVRLIGNWIAVTLEKIETEAALTEARDTAERASQAKSLFLANMSHEIRTPLTSIIGYTNLLRDRGLDEGERQQNMDYMLRSSAHLQQIINNILDLTKIEAGKLYLEHMAVSPVRLVQEVEALALPKAENKGLDFDVQYHFPLPREFTSDALRVRQVLLNLIDNAIKFTDRGVVTLAVSYRRDQSELHFTVTDSGIGMSSDQVNQVFKAFTQADESTTRKYGGTGLGLSISRQLAHLLDGELICTSEPARGSAFSLVLRTAPPVELEIVDTLAAMQDGVTVMEKEEQQSFQGTVLLVEDNLVNQRFIQAFMKKIGVNVDCAGNGLEGLELARKNAYDLILMDLQMPVMDGMTATRALRKAEVNTPIIALTANALEEDKEACLNNGFDQYFIKPIDLDLFYAMLAKYLDIRITA